MSSTQTRFFEETFQKEKNQSGQWEYRFCHKWCKHNGTTTIPCSILGKQLPSEQEDGELMDEEEEKQIFRTLPSDCMKDETVQQVYDVFTKDCGKWFQKCPTQEAFRNGLQHSINEEAHIASLGPGEEEFDWQLLWIPTMIRIVGGKYTICWAPCYKLKQPKQSRLISDEDMEDEPLIPELQGPEFAPTYQEGNTRLIHTAPSTTVRADWLQEIPESMLPYSDVPALRLDEEFLAQREKYRKRVREARIRAKLARYRAERIAQRFEERFGVYPDEDEEEAQTEAEQTEDDM
jgi:hypothetical protein